MLQQEWNVVLGRDDQWILDRRLSHTQQPSRACRRVRHVVAIGLAAFQRPVTAHNEVVKLSERSARNNHRTRRPAPLLSVGMDNNARAMMCCLQINKER